MHARSNLRCLLAGFTVAASVIAVPVHAAPLICAAPLIYASPLTTEAREQASALFARGEALYRIGDFSHAAPLFDEANRLAPHPNILWNAARAYDGAGDYARAANEYEEYLAISSETEPDRKDAVKALARLSRKLGRLRVLAPAQAILLVDNVRATSLNPFVLPGSHAVHATFGDREETQTVQIEIGASRSLTFPTANLTAKDPPASASLTPVLEAQRARPQEEREKKSYGASPWVFVTGTVLTATAGGLAIGFGIGTHNARSRFDAAPTTQAFEDGRDKQFRTNLTLGIAAGLGALTAITGIWLTDWKGRSRHSGAGFSPSLGGLAGTF